MTLGLAQKQMQILYHKVEEKIMLYFFTYIILFIFFETIC